MGSSAGKRVQTRREFLGNAARLGAGAAALAALGPGAMRAASAQGGPPERVEVLMADVGDATAADFGRGRLHGVELVTRGGQAELRSTGGGEFTSGSMAFPFPATHLGLHWKARSIAAEALSVSARTSADGQSWSDWQPLHIEAVADLSGGASAESAIPVHGHGHDIGTANGAPVQREVFASLIDGGRARFAQYRVTFPTGETSALGAMTITALNSVDGPRKPVASTARQTQVFTCPDGRQFTVITREGWGCDERLRFRGKTREIWPEMYVPSKKVVLHHTATSNTYTDGAAEVRAIYNYHARTLGWGDIGYQVLIDNQGNVYEGRHGRGEDAATREILSDDVVAGHVYAHNYGSTGIAVVGNFDEIEPNSTILQKVEDLMTFECGRQFIEPGSASSFLRSDGVWHSAMANITGHKDSYNTACPGAKLYPHLGSLRSNVAARLGSSVVPEFSESSTAEGDLVAPADLAFGWSSSADSYSICLEGWYKASNSENISYLQGYAPAGYGDSLAMQQVWTGTTATSAAWEDLPAGHYTMHVRTADGRYEASRTYLVKGS